MKKTILGLATAAALGAIATPAAAQVYGDTARVISATPIYDHVAMPRRECRIEPTSGYEERRVRPGPDEPRAERNDGIGPGAVLGAIVGGVIGHQLGNSTGGRDHGTAAGAVIGGLVGNSIEKDSDDGYPRASRDAYVERVPVTRDVERCDTIADAEERIVGYEVRYEYNGREFRARMPYDPGEQMPVNVEVRPPLARESLAGPRTPNYRGTY
jgi:uncharacterized protein YcfJ